MKGAVPQRRPEQGLSAAQETELKLALSAEDAHDLHRREFARARVHHLVSVYYDTPDRRLLKAGLTVRLRSDGDRWVQTVKDEGLGLTRFEDEASVKGAALDLERLGRGPVANLIEGAVLEPVFETRVLRRIQRIRVGEAAIELALDQGEVVAGEARLPLAELELELKSGEASALFSEARRFIETTGASVSLVTKAERGQALAAGRAGRPVKFRPPRLRREMSCREAFQALAFAAVRQLQANVLLPEGGDAIEAAHQARVSLRRLRATLSAFKAMLSDDRREAVEAELKRLTGIFATARTLDVFIAETFQPFADADAGSAEFGRALLQAQAEAHAQVRADTAARDYRMAVLEALEWISVGPWTWNATTRSLAERPIATLAPDLLDHRRRAMRKRGGRLDWRDPLPRHRLRIQAKKMRYLAEAFAPLCGDAKAFVEALQVFLDLAGRLNDIAGAPAAAALALSPTLSQDAVFAAGRLVGERRTEEHRLIRKARKAFEGFESEPPFWRTR